MANEQLNKLQSAMTRTTAAIGVKTSVFVGSAKLKTHISTLKKEITSLTHDLGTAVYGSWEKGESDPEQIKSQCLAIKEKYDSIKELEIEISKLEKQEAEVLGAKKQEGAAPISKDDAYTCQSCGAAYDTQIKFCRKCGAKMA